MQCRGGWVWLGFGVGCGGWMVEVDRKGGSVRLCWVVEVELVVVWGGICGRSGLGWMAVWVGPGRGVLLSPRRQGLRCIGANTCGRCSGRILVGRLPATLGVWMEVGCSQCIGWIVGGVELVAG